MKVSKLRPVYKEPGKPNLPDAAGRSGVYLIYEAQPWKITAKNVLVYVGHSQVNLYKTILRHFQSWDDPTQIRVVYDQSPLYKVRIVYCGPVKAQKLERALIVKYRPRDNPDKLETIEREDLSQGEQNVLLEFAQLPKEDLTF